MSRWQDSAEDGGDPLRDWSAAFELYLRYLAWPRVSTAYVFLLPFLPLGIVALGQPWSVSLVQLRLPAIAIVCVALPAYLLSALCLGPESQANEAFYASNLSQAGFDPRQGYDTRPAPLRFLSLTWLVYQSDCGYFPGGRRGWAYRNWSERYQAQCTVNGATHAYYRACMVAGLPPVRPAELAALVLLNAVAAASLALMVADVALHPGTKGAAGPPQMVALCAFLVFLDTGILLGTRGSARLEAFIRALQTHLEELPALAANQAEPPPRPPDPQDTGWG